MNEPEQFASYNNPEFEHLICCICEGVFVDPVQCPSEHYFCRKCITQWLCRSQTCPVDRDPLVAEDLRPPSRILRDILASLQLSCRFRPFGCSEGIHTDEEMQRKHLSCCHFRSLPLKDHNYCWTTTESTFTHSHLEEEETDASELSNNKRRRETDSSITNYSGERSLDVSDCDWENPGSKGQRTKSKGDEVEEAHRLGWFEAETDRCTLWTNSPWCIWLSRRRWIVAFCQLCERRRKIKFSICVFVPYHA